MWQAGRPQRGEYLVLALVFALSLGVFWITPPWVHGDGTGYFAYLRSAVLDGDLDFRNEYQHYNQRTTAQLLNASNLTTGRVPNIWAVGPAFLWAPAYLLTHAGMHLAHQLGSADTPDGYSPPYVYAVALSSATYGFVALLLVHRWLRRHFGLLPATLALATVWLATSLPAYMYFHPTLAHAASVFTVCCFLAFWDSTRRRRTLRQWGVLGALGGLMLLTRWQNGLFFLVPAIEQLATLVHHARRTDALQALAAEVGRRLLGWGLAAITLVVVFAPQMAIWQLLFAKWLTNPQREYSLSTGFTWTAPHAIDVLISTRHGLFTWTPVLLLAVIGLVLFARRDRVLAVGLGASLLAQVYVVGSWSNWWQGASFGGRMFIEWTPAYALGIAALLDLMLDQQRSRAAAAAAAIWLLSTWNALLLYRYGFKLLPSEDDPGLQRLVGGQGDGLASFVQHFGIAPLVGAVLVLLLAVAAIVLPASPSNKSAYWGTKSAPPS